MGTSLDWVRTRLRWRLDSLVKHLVSSELTRRGLNVAYNRLSPGGQAVFYDRYANMFRRDAETLPSGTWRVRFAGRPLDFPITSERFALDWNLALSALGHDPEVKRIYRALLGSPWKVNVFFDIGTNYGLHSLLLLAHQVRVISFEPNPECHRYFEHVAELNGVACDLRPLALSDAPGRMNLSFPDGLTWLGTIDASAARGLEQSFPLRTISVEVSTLDAFVERYAEVPDLIKIDTEGHEHAVLQGARRTLQNARPLVVLESRREDANRTELFKVLADCDYALLPLTANVVCSEGAVELPSFLVSSETNFVAVPAERRAALVRILSSN